MKIFLVRHGQTTGDVEDRYGGDYDDHLTEEGKKQAAILAEKLSGKSIEIIFSSPRIRAKETSEILKDILGYKVEVVDDLRERSAYGELTGMIKKEAKEKYPVQAELLKDYRNTIEGAETYENFKARIQQAFVEIANQDHGTVAVITHGGPIRCLFREFFKWGELKELGDCAFFEIGKTGDSFSLVSVSNASLE